MTSFGLTNSIDLNDSDLLELEKIDKWARKYAGRRMSIDQFARDIEEQINKVGFSCEVKLYDTNEPGVYAFEVEINGRISGQFDPDKMVWEVTQNVLELPGQTKGFIPTKDAAAKLLNRDIGKDSHKH